MCECDKPNYFAILPADVRYDNRLTADDKLLYAEITALTQMNGACYASTKYFSELLGGGERTVRNSLKRLEEAGYIERVIIYKPGTKEVEKRLIRLSHPAETEYPTWGIEVPQPGETDFRENNNPTDSNNIIPPVINKLITSPLETKLPSKQKKKISEEVKKKFDEWWKVYPVKKSKLAALNKFDEVLREQSATFDELMEGARK